MVKTHEKSRIYAVVGTDNVKNIEKVVLQMEATGQISGGYLIYLVETVAAEDYDRTTAEGRAIQQQEENGSSRTDFLLIYKVFSFTVLVMGISKSTKYIFIF